MMTWPWAATCRWSCAPPATRSCGPGRLILEVVGFADGDRLARGLQAIRRHRRTVFGSGVHIPGRRPSEGDGEDVVGRDVDQPDAMARVRPSRQARRTLAVHHDRLGIVRDARLLGRDAASPEHDHVIVSGSNVSPGVRHDERAVQTRRQLTEVVQVRVVDERARARRREADDEACRPARSSASTLLADAAPAVHAVVVALELDAVPVNGRRLGETIDERDLDRLVAPQHDRGPGRAAGPPPARFPFAQHETGRWRALAPSPRCIASVSFRGAIVPAGGAIRDRRSNGDANDHPRHAGRAMLPRARGCRSACSCAGFVGRGGGPATRGA